MTEEQTTPTPAPKRGVRLSTQIIIWVALMALLVLVGLGLKKAQNPIISIGSEVPDFPLEMFEGYSYQGASEVHLADLQGKVVVINFWASWCKPCEQEAAELEEAWRFYEEDGEVVFLGIAWTDTPDNAADYLNVSTSPIPMAPTWVRAFLPFSTAIWACRKPISSTAKASCARSRSGLSRP